ncbi:glycosyltransferase family 2 protein [Glycomyces niveus]|uniref:Glycosyltransferase family 2 protein n=1 Tax=Glycomyces niveus TaxID=2820287 RepID=A0ABS3U912_9ACTN|nr:glycosyltransferase family A protein [Glycomyces sp. NEAU-S30]MBO3735261.1 glycosyltransferase family 2 protein [Glycomyces sp. NEAU-S30]
MQIGQMRIDNPAATPEMTRRALAFGKPASIGRIYEWGLYHRSRLAVDVLARLAHPDDPGVFRDLPAGADRMNRDRCNLRAVAALGSYLTLMARDADEYAWALEVFELAQRLGPGRVPAEHHDMYVNAAYLAGRHERARQLLDELNDVGDALRRGLPILESHPRHGGSAHEYLRRFKQFVGWPDLLELGEGDTLGFESLRTAPVKPVEHGPLISVVMTCYKPGPALLSAVRSIVAQSWQQWELLLVDDGSGPEYEAVLREAARLDSRVKILIQSENGGTYQARNRAMAVAQGEFVTGLDSDDWAHPLRLERQAAAMIDNPRLVMVESRSLAVRDDLALMVDPEVALVASRSTLVMVRTDAIREHIGFHDEVRKTADSEFRMRVKEHFGRRAWRRMKGEPLTLVRYTGDTLSSGEVGRYWMTTSRLAYHSGFTHWHRRISAGQATAFLHSYSRPRPFPITEDITLPNARLKDAAYDRVYAADWRHVDTARSALLDAAANDAETGLQVALAHCPEWHDVDGERGLIHPSVLETASAKGMRFIDDTGSAPVVVPTDAYRELYLFEHPDADAALVQSAGHAETPAPEHPVVPRARFDRAAAPLRDAVRRRDLAAAALGLVAVAAEGAVAWAVAPETLPWALAAGATLWIGASGAVLTWKAASALRP